ncbi:MAG: hypothetical protein K2X80_02900, partial [Pseudomonadaceae bacterium]|nr:hypothetical protein [Pseudomonadaceae bacterium]
AIGANGDPWQVFDLLEPYSNSLYRQEKDWLLGWLCHHFDYTWTKQLRVLWWSKAVMVCRHGWSG